MHHKMVDPWSRNEFMAYEPKVVAFDFDETISDNETAWMQVMMLLEEQGYHCIVVTWRTPTTYPEDLQLLVDRGWKVYYTSGQAKQRFMEQQGIKVSIWIDDNPFAILHSQGD